MTDAEKHELFLLPHSWVVDWLKALAQRAGCRSPVFLTPAYDPLWLLEPKNQPADWILIRDGASGEIYQMMIWKVDEQRPPWE